MSFPIGLGNPARCDSVRRPWAAYTHNKRAAKRLLDPDQPRPALVNLPLGLGGTGLILSRNGPIPPRDHLRVEADLISVLGLVFGHGVALVAGARRSDDVCPDRRDESIEPSR